MELWITIIVVIVILFYLVSIYNKLVSYKNRFKNAFSQIDVQLQRRYDLIPNLVETAKGYMAHEKSTLEAVIQARNAAVSASKSAADNPGDASTMKELAAAETLLTGSLGKLFALSESYPDLKANETMNNLMEELTTTENKIAFARQAFNDSVMQYNILREQFPSNMIAGFYGFAAAELLEIEEPAAKKPVKVSF
ncbi:MAG: LemA family protein [Gammaproteobacteria bacterium]|nr:LemA family protein [Gammaproteobacteria bacterium]MDH5628593.1 LemA family protein [Gammaproteobacteria bacterium]